MSSFPSLSIVIPSYNQGAYIERTLLSILKQDYPGEVEVIVSDGGSKDETVEVLKKYPQVKWWSQRDEGFVDAVTKGFAVAKGEILAIQSSDDFYLKDAFKKSIKELIQEDSLSIVAGCDVYMQPDRKTFSVSDLDSHLITPHSLLVGRVIPQHCAFFRRGVLEKVNGLRREVDTCADIDFWYRALHFFKGKFIPHYTAAYQYHANQRTQVLDTWYSSLVRTVETCEADHFYAERFRFTDDDKKNLYVRWEVQFGLKQADRDQLMQKMNDIMKSPNYTEETKQYVYQVGLSKEIFKGKTRSERVLTSILDGSFPTKAIKKIEKLTTSPPKVNSGNTSIDIDWWKHH